MNPFSTHVVIILPHDVRIEKLKTRICLILPILAIFFGIILTILAILRPPQNIITLTISAIIIGFTSIVVLRIKGSDISMKFQILVIAILLTYGAWITQSASTYSLTSLLIVVASLYGYDKIVHILFVYSMGFITFMLLLGKYTLHQTFINGSNIALVNNVQILIALIVVSYGCSYIVHFLLLETIRYQEQRYLVFKQSKDTEIQTIKIKNEKVVTSGLAHDLNGILGIIKGNVDILEIEGNLSHGQIEHLKNINYAIDNAKKLSNKMMDAVKSSLELNVKKINMNSLISQLIQMNFHDKDNLFHLEIDDNLLILGNELEIFQVVQNLLINVMEASTTVDGIIQITGRSLSLNNENQPNIYNLQPGEYVEIHIIDQGVGVSPEAEDQIFSLFYTTKANGNGIGLAIARSIIEDYGGQLDFERKRENGANFYFILPAVIAS